MSNPSPTAEQQAHKLTEEIRRLKSDFRAEVILANWQEEGLDFQTIIRPRGLSARNYDRDILRAKYNIKQDLFFLDLNRRGLYDTLPESFFHQPGIGKARNREQATEMAKHSRAQRREEEEARKFFLPLEQRLYRARLELELAERKALTGFVDPDFLKVFIEFWDIPADLSEVSEAQKALLCYLLPLAHQVVGNPHATVQLLEIILQVPVQWITVEANEARVADSVPPATLGTVNLGMDFILGDVSVVAHPMVIMRVGPVAEADIAAYLPDGNQRNVLEALYTFLIPVGYIINTQVIPQKAEFVFDNQTDTYLGYNTTL